MFERGERTLWIDQWGGGGGGGDRGTMGGNGWLGGDKANNVEKKGLIQLSNDQKTPEEGGRSRGVEVSRNRGRKREGW